MRALEHLASAYRGEDLYKDAIGIYEKMLALNPNDNQGVRDPLLGLYLALGSTDEASKLLEAYKDDSMANFAWGRVLERFLCHDLPGAAVALTIARKQNRFVELFLSGQRNFPQEYAGNVFAGQRRGSDSLSRQSRTGLGELQASFFLAHGTADEEGRPKEIGCRQIEDRSSQTGKEAQ